MKIKTIIDGREHEWESIPNHLNIDVSKSPREQFDYIVNCIDKLNESSNHAESAGLFFEKIQVNLFIDCLKNIKGYPYMMELGSGGIGSSNYSILFEKYFNYECGIINAEPVKYLIDAVPIYWKGIHLVNAKLYHGYIGNSAQLSTNNQNSLNLDMCGVKLSVSKLMSDNGIEKLNILHADIQEREVDLLLELESDNYLKKIKYFFISTHSFQLHEKCEEIFNRNSINHYHFNDMTKGGHGDGLIVVENTSLD
jgi:hypothetical protein